MGGLNVTDSLVKVLVWQLLIDIFCYRSVGGLAWIVHQIIDVPFLHCFL